MCLQYALYRKLFKTKVVFICIVQEIFSMEICVYYEIMKNVYTVRINETVQECNKLLENFLHVRNHTPNKICDIELTDDKTMGYRIKFVISNVINCWEISCMMP
jgi:hypothetical protein